MSTTPTSGLSGLFKNWLLQEIWQSQQSLLTELAQIKLTELAQIKAALAALQREGLQIMQELDDLQSEVERDTSVISSATTLINGFAAQLAAAGTDPAKLAALRTKLSTNVDALAAAVAANTPAAA